MASVIGVAEPWMAAHLQIEYACMSGPQNAVVPNNCILGVFDKLPTCQIAGGTCCW